MQTRACPSCSEVIPVEVDYCPYCGESTRETLMTDEDIAQAEAAQRRRETIPDPIRAPLGPPQAGTYMCMMCHDAEATMGDYCLNCKQKLDLRPEEWDIKKTDDTRRNLIIGSVVGAVVLILVIVLITSFARHPHHLNTAIPSAGHASTQ